MPKLSEVSGAPKPLRLSEVEAQATAPAPVDLAAGVAPVAVPPTAAPEAPERGWMGRLEDAALMLRSGTRNVAGGAVGAPVNLANAVLDPLPARLIRRGMEAVTGADIGAPLEALGVPEAIGQPDAVRGIRESLAITGQEDRRETASDKLKGQFSGFDDVDGFLPALEYLIDNPSFAAMLGVEQIPQVALPAVPGSTLMTIGAQGVSAGSQVEGQIATELAAAVERGEIDQATADLIGSDAFLASAGINTALPFLPGASTLERMAALRPRAGTGGIVSGAVRGAAGEGLQGVLSEGSDQVIENLGTGDPWSQDLGKSMALGLALEGTLGAGAGAGEGAMSRPAPPPAPQPGAAPDAPTTLDELLLRELGAAPGPAAPAQAVAAGETPGASVDSQASADPLMALLEDPEIIAALGAITGQQAPSEASATAVPDGEGGSPAPAGAVSPDLATALAMDEDAYIQAVNPTGKRSSPEDEIAFAAGDIAAPADSVVVDELGFTDKQGQPVEVLRGPDGTLYARAGDQVVGSIESREGETLNAVAKEFQGRGIGSGLARALMLTEPMAEAGSFSDAGEAARRSAFRQLKAERAPKESTDLGEAAAPKRQKLSYLAGQVGWAEQGGRLLRERRDGDDDMENFAQRSTGDVIGRTKWIPQTDPVGRPSTFWRDRPMRITEAEAKEALRRADAGESLTRKQQRFVDYAEQYHQDYMAEGEEEAQRERESGFDPDRIQQQDGGGMTDLERDAEDVSRAFDSEGGGFDLGAAVPFSRRAPDLFGQPSAREEVDAARRRRDAERDGRTSTGRTDMAAGDGELFAGPRPAQADIEGAPESRTTRAGPRPPTVEDSLPSQIDADAEFDATLEGARRNVRDLKAMTSYQSRAIRAALGGAARNVELVGAWSDLPADVAARVQPSDQTEGFFDPVTGRVFLLVDDRLTPERAAWVAFHETAGHLGLRGAAIQLAKGDRAAAGRAFVAALDRAGENATVGAIAQAIEAGNPDYDLTRATEEALAELAAARRTGNYDAIGRRYQVPVPPSLRPGIDGVIDRFMQAVRRFLAAMTGKRTTAMTDAQVLRLLDDAWRFAQTAEPGAAGRMGAARQESRQEDQGQNLVAVHNTTAEKLAHAMRMGGFAVPSIAVMRPGETITGFGDITLIGDSALVDPAKGAKAFGADVYSPRYPEVMFKLDAAAVRKLNAALGAKGAVWQQATSVRDVVSEDAFKDYAERTLGPNWKYSQAEAEAGRLLREAGAQEVTFEGFTNMGNRRYKPHTLENVVKKLKRELRGGENWNYGVGSLRAKFTPQFRSIAKMRSEKGRLRSKEDFEAVKAEVDAEFFKITEALSPFSTDGQRFGFADTVIDMMGDVAKMGVPSALKDYGMNSVPENVQRDIAGFLGKLKDMPTEYFEVIQPRAVGLEEFRAAVVPSDASSDVRSILESEGIEVVEYPRGDDAARRNAVLAVASSKDILFSRRATMDGRGQRSIEHNGETFVERGGDYYLADANGAPRDFNFVREAEAEATRVGGEVRQDAPTDGRRTWSVTLPEGVRQAGEREFVMESRRDDQTQTPEFRRWFKDSKVVDADGNPLVVYHGTATPRFVKFAKNPKGGIGGPLGIWFASDPAATESFSRQRYADEGGATYPVFLSVQNPLEFHNWQDFVAYITKMRKSGSIEAGMKAARRSAISRGFDGVVIRNSDTDGGVVRDDWVAFEPTQIKSSTGNRGTFDLDSASILESRRPESDFTITAATTAQSVIADGRALSLIDEAKKAGLDLGPLRDAYARKDGPAAVAAMDALLAELRPDTRRTTAIKNAVTDAERAEAGRDPILRDAVQANEDTVVAAMRELRDDPSAGDEAIARINRGGDISLADAGILLVYKTQLMNERNAAADVLADPKASDARKDVARETWNRTEAKISALDQAASRSGTEAGRMLQFRQRQMREDFTLAALERKERARLERPLTREESANIKEMADTIARLQERVDRLNERIANAGSESVYENVVKQMTGRGPKKRPTLESLRRAADEARARLRAAPDVPRRRGQSGAVMSPTVFKDLAVIGAFHIADGAAKLADWVSAMRADVGDWFDNFKADHPRLFQASQERAVKAEATVAEVLAKVDLANITPANVRRLVEAHVGEGVRGEPAVVAAVAKDLGIEPGEVRRLFVQTEPRPPQTLTEAKEELRDLRRIIRIEAEIARLESGQPKPKRGQPAVDSPAVAAKKLELAALRASLRPDPETRYQDMRGRQIKKRIEDIEARIAAGDFEPRVRIPRALNASNQQAQFELTKAKEDFARYQFEDEIRRRSPLAKVFGGIADVFNLSRAVMTSFDLSAPLRQGGFIVLGNPMRGLKGFVPMLRAFGSAQAEHNAKADIESRPNAPLYKKYGLELTGIGAGPLSQIEEAYASRWLDKLPTAIGGGLVRGSGRAYTSFLNRLRADTFDAMTASLTRTGVPTEAEGNAIANFINVATGRGPIGGREKAGEVLNTVFFAPRLVASRFQLLSGQPLYAGSARTRRMIAKEYARYLMGAGVVLGLAAFGLGDDEDEKPIVGMDPRSADFGKIRVGNTYVDPLSGLAQVTVFLSRLATGETVGSSGEAKPVRQWGTLTDLRRAMGEDIPAHELNPDGTLGFGSASAADLIGRFLRTKLAPAPGAIVNSLSGENLIGEQVSPLDAAKELATPMSFGDIADAMEEHGIPKGAALGLLVIFGMGVNTRDQASPLTATTTARTDIKERLSVLPVDQWETEMESMREEYGPVMDGVSLAIYKRDGKYGKEGEPRRTAEGMPVLITERLSDGTKARRNYQAALEAKGLSQTKVTAQMARSAVHHVIPDNVVRQHPLMIHARTALDYDLDQPSNLVGLSKEKTEGTESGAELGHWTDHPFYDMEVVSELDKAQRKLRRKHGDVESAPRQEVLDAIRKVEEAMRKRIEAQDVPKKDGRLAGMNATGQGAQA